MTPLEDDEITLYRKQIMSIAWLVRTRLLVCNCCCDVGTNCSAPRDIDNRDLAYIIGFIANNLNAGMVIDCKDVQLYLYVDVGHATHEDKKSHTGGLVSMGKLGEHGQYHSCGSPSSRRLRRSVPPPQNSSECQICSIFFNALMSWRSSFKLDRTVFQDNTSTITIDIWVVPRLMQSADSTISATSGLKNT
jgi:hypothetical protein